MQASRDSARVAAARDVFLRFVASHGTVDAGAFERLSAEHPEIASELRAAWAEWNAGTDVAQAPTAARSAHELLATLSSTRRPRAGREIARGGMGAIVEAWDGELNRRLAMKTMLASAGGPTSSAALARFLEEAQVTGQLEHPGIVPVHQLGVDDRGRPFFTMRLVEGRDVRAVFELAWAGAEGWNETRALGVLQKVCEAMAYAHDKGVLHRDLKPANVMTGRFGEVYVMDWGVARVLGREDAHGLHREVATVRSGDGAAVLVTRDGDVVGTPAYMAPEQARGEVERLSPQSDIYSVGAMLYHLLARHAPYVENGRAALSVLTRVLSGPPRPLAALDPPPPPELLAICERAMAREPGDRYASMLDFADDLRAYLEGHVVRAYESGAWAELRKWVLRNRALATSIAAALLFLVGGLVAVWWAEADKLREVERRNAEITREKTRADDNAATAAREAERARQEALTAERSIAFLDDLFKDQAPTRALGERVTVASVLERGAQRIRDELKDEPQVRTRLMESIGTAYAGLGLPAEAQPMLSEALEFARATRGHDDAGALRVQQRLADALLVSRDFAQARELLEDLVATFARTGRSAERESFDALRGLVIADMTAQDFAGAEARLRELLRACAASTACRPALAAQFRFQLAQALFLLKELDAAEAELATLFESATDATDPLCLGRAHSLSSHIAAARRDLDLAEQHARDALALFERAAAPKPTDVASALNDLCWLAGARGDFDAAVEFARRALAIDREVYGDLHASTLRHQTALAETLFSAGRVEEAEPLARGALDAWPKLGATFHADWSRSLRVMAQIYMEQGRLHEAEAAALERWERTPESAPDKAHMRDLLDQVRARIEASAESDR